MNGPVTVLHVDDDPTFGDLVADALERTGDRFTVVTETDPTECLDIIDSRDIDCVVSDYEMPEMNGIELLDRVRRVHPDLPFFLFTGKGSEEIASEAIAAGVTDYLQKSGGMEQYELLANRISHTVSRYRTAERAEKLERIRRVLRDVNKELVRSRTRTELEAGVCEILAAARPYSIAWIGEREGESLTIEPRASAGDDDGFLTDVQIQLGSDSDDEGSFDGALQRGEITVIQDIPAETGAEPWQARALEWGYRSSAVIPLTFEDTVYGVLVVYSTETEAFSEAERNLLRELGSDIGHAIHRIEQEERYRRLFQESVNGIAVHEIITGESGEPVDYTFLEVNDAFEDLTGLSASEVEGKRVGDVLSGLDRSFIERFGRVALDGETVRFEEYSEPLDSYYDVSASRFPTADSWPRSRTLRPPRNANRSSRGSSTR